MLYIEGASQLQVQISMEQGTPGQKAQLLSEDAVALVSETMELPGRSISLVSAHVPADCHQEGLVEPRRVGELAKHLLLPRTLVRVGTNQEIVVQVNNTGPSPVKIYKGTKLGTTVTTTEMAPSPPEVDLTLTDLASAEKEQLLELLTQYSDVFATPDGTLGKTSMVKHEVQTTGPPIRQPVRKLPESLKGAVSEELQKMLQQGVVSPSNSPWSSPIVMVRKGDGSWHFCVEYCKVNATI